MAAIGEARIRRVRPSDAAAIRAIYRPHVEESRVTFEIDCPDETEIFARIAKAEERYPWLVAENDGVMLGYAYASMFRERPAYRFAAETSVYLAERALGRGIGGALYRRLLDILTEQGFVHAIGAITLPNPASVRLHLRSGFVSVGSYPDIGHKLGEWASVGLYQKSLRELPAVPAEPLPLSASPTWSAMAP